MPAYMKVDGIKGESTDKGHPGSEGWLIIQSLSAPVFRSIPEGARDQQRSRGATTLGDVVVVRELDRSSVDVQAACANGKYYETVQIDLCSSVKGKSEPYLTYVLHDVIFTSYAFHGNASGDPLPTEELTMNYTKVEWTYNVLDPKTGDKVGNAPGSYSPGEGN